MAKKIYKYAASTIFDKIFEDKSICSVKCALPKDYNDPYELFLTIDYNQKPDILAYYLETIGEITQKPTSCFSRSPVVIPMWAHYANNHDGFVIEIDQDKLLELFPEIGIGDIDYKEKPDDGILNKLEWAYGTCKPRHVYFFQRAVLSAAYYTKDICWEYEQETRIVLNDGMIKQKEGHMLFGIPYCCITSIISGIRNSNMFKNSLREKCYTIGCNFYEMKIGRLSAKPFLINNSNESYSFIDSKITANSFFCEKCLEPISSEIEKCSWCSINKYHKQNAAYKNPMRLIADAGLLKGYYQDMENISKRNKTPSKSSKN